MSLDGMPDAILDSRLCPLVIVVDREGVARVTGDGSAPPEQIVEWLEILLEAARAKAGL